MTIDNTGEQMEMSIKSCDVTTPHYDYINRVSPDWKSWATTSPSTFDISVEHLKEQLDLAKNEIRDLKHELAAEKERSDKQKEYYESLIKDYRKIANDSMEKAEHYKEKAESTMLAVGNLIKLLAGE